MVQKSRDHQLRLVVYSIIIFRVFVPSQVVFSPDLSHQDERSRSTPRFQSAHFTGQIIATSHDLTPNGGLVRELPLFQGNSRLVKYYNLAKF